ncbi:MAG: IS1182 family transposase [Nanoarchaeota archaeon]|nr:IS1182 family transposase [Nanoarchaeota archaeon]
MLGKKKFEPKLMYNLTIDDLVPEDNFYRVLDDLLDLRFVYQECKNLYGKTGNPSIDPVVFFKLMLFGYFENVTSDRNLIKRASDSLSVRYYLGYDIDEKLPWHSTISRTRILIKEETFQLIFNKIVQMCYQAQLIEGTHQSIDSTLVKANASLEKAERKAPELRVEEYVKKSYAENSPEEIKKDEKTRNDKDQDNQLKIAEKTSDTEQSNKRNRNKTYYSKTDPDSRMATKPGKPSAMYYSTHYSVDSKNKIITDVLTSYADRGDNMVLLEVIERTENRLNNLGLTIQEVSADKGYCSGENLRELENRNITAYIPTQRFVNNKGGFNSDKFIYNEEKDLFNCPNNKELKFHCYDNEKQRNRYVSKKEDCGRCPLKQKCCPNSSKRHLSRTIYYKEYERLSLRLKTPGARRAYVLRKTGPEPLFGEAKMYHGLQKFMTRGLEKCQKNSIIIASVQNLKRLLSSVKRKTKKAEQKNKYVKEFIIEKLKGLFSVKLYLTIESAR